MGFLAPLIPAAAGAAGTGAAAGGTAAAAAGTAAATTAATTALAASVPFDASLAGAGAATTGAATAAGGLGAAGAGVGAGTAAAGAGIKSALLSSALTTGGSLAASSLIRPPKFPKGPQAPDFSTFLKPGSTALIGGNEGSFGGTFLGNNRSPQISGGKKTLLGA